MEHEKHKRKLNKLNINYVIPVVNNNLTKGQQLYTQQQLKKIAKSEKIILQKEKKVYTKISGSRCQELSVNKVTRNQIYNHNNNINYQFCKNFKKFIKIFPKSALITNKTLKRFMFWLCEIFMYNFYEWRITTIFHSVYRKPHKLIKMKLSNMIEKTDFTRFFHNFIMIHFSYGQDFFDGFKDILCFMPVRTQRMLLTLIVERYKYNSRCYPRIDIITMANHLILDKRYNAKYISRLLRKILKGKIGIFSSRNFNVNTVGRYIKQNHLKIKKLLSKNRNADIYIYKTYSPKDGLTLLLQYMSHGLVECYTS